MLPIVALRPEHMGEDRDLYQATDETEDLFGDQTALRGVKKKLSASVSERVAGDLWYLHQARATCGGFPVCGTMQGAILAYTPAGISIEIPVLTKPDPPAGIHTPSEA